MIIRSPGPGNPSGGREFTRGRNGGAGTGAKLRRLCAGDDQIEPELQILPGTLAIAAKGADQLSMGAAASERMAQRLINRGAIGGKPCPV